MSFQHKEGSVSMIDIHTHIIDDAEDIEASLALLRMAVGAGTTDIVATPYISEGTELAKWQLIKERTEKLNSAAQEKGIPIHVYAGAELEMNWNLLSMLKTGQEDYCLAGSRYILIKLPQNNIPSYAEDFFYEIQVKELTPIIAHPERHYVLTKHPDMLHQWIKELGVMVQCNIDSFTYKYGMEVKNFADLLIRNNMVHFLGSDVNSRERRNKDIGSVLKLLKEKLEPNILERITRTNSQAVIENRYIDVNVAKELLLPYDKSKGFLKRLFG